MAAAVGALTGHFDEMLAVGVGIVVTDYIGDTVKGWINSVWAGAGAWADPLAEILIGLAILFVGEWFAPFAWKTYTRLAAFGAVGLGIANAVKILLGRASSSPSGSSTGGGQGSPEGSVGFI